MLQTMAYGLRTIVNKGYIPYGSGRDWFFIGDYEYGNGRKTPKAEDRYKIERMVKPCCNRPRGQPTEMAYGPYFGTTEWKKGKYQNRNCQSTGALPNVKSCSLVPHDTRTDAIHRRWKTAHESPTNIESPCADIWRRQVVVGRDVKHASDNVPDWHDTASHGTKPSVNRGHCTIIQTGAKEQPVAPPSALRFAHATSTSASYGQFQHVPDSAHVMKDKYKSFSTHISHPSRHAYMDDQ